jgi:hypothetical protein
MSRPPYTIQENIDVFWKNVDKKGPDDCWVFKGTKRGNYGYMRNSIKAKNDYAHRFSYELHKGDATGLNVCHTCDNTICVNPDHFF